MKKEIKTGIKMRVTPEQSVKVQEIVFANNGVWIDNTKEVALTGIPFLFIDDDNYLSLTMDEKYFLSCDDFEEVSAELFISTQGTCIQEEQPKVKLSEFLKQNLCYDAFILETLKFQEATCPAEIVNVNISSAFVWEDTKQGERFWKYLDFTWGEIPHEKIYDMDALVRDVWLKQYEEVEKVEEAPTEVSLSDFTNEFPTLGLAFAQAIQEKAHEEFAKGGYTSYEQQKDSVGIVHKEQLQGVDYDKLFPNPKPLVTPSKEYTEGIRLPLGEALVGILQPEKIKKEYLIIVEGGKAPKVVHTNLKSAEVEAKRLSAKEVGREVFIMEKVKSFKSKVVVEVITDEKLKGDN